MKRAKVSLFFNPAQLVPLLPISYFLFHYPLPFWFHLRDSPSITFLILRKQRVSDFVFLFEKMRVHVASFESVNSSVVWNQTSWQPETAPLPLFVLVFPLLLSYSSSLHMFPNSIPHFFPPKAEINKLNPKQTMSRCKRK